jgi:hypothetical protein
MDIYTLPFHALLKEEKLKAYLQKVVQISVYVNEN